MLQRAIRSHFAKIKDSTQHLLVTDPTLPLYHLLHKPAPALVIALKQYNSICVLLGPQSSLQGQSESLQNSKVTYKRGIVNSLFGCHKDNNSSQNQKGMIVDLHQLDKKASSSYTTSMSLAYYDSPYILLNYTNPIVKDGFTLYQGKPSLRQDFVLKLLHKHSGPVVVLAFSTSFLDQVCSIRQDSFCFRPEVPGQTLLLPAVVKNICQQLAEKNQNVLLIVEQFEMLDEHRKLLAKEADIPHQSLTCFTQLLYNESLNRKQGSITTLIGLSPEQRFSQSIAYSHGIRSLAKPINLPLSTSRSAIKGRMSSFLDQLFELKREESAKANFGIKEDPWQKYFILDSDWWVRGLMDYELGKDLQNCFQEFLAWNIEEDHVSRWKVPAVEAFFKLVEKESRERMVEINEKDKQWECFQQFLIAAKLQGMLHQYKKDYF